MPQISRLFNIQKPPKALLVLLTVKIKLWVIIYFASHMKIFVTVSFVKKKKNLLQTLNEF